MYLDLLGVNQSKTCSICKLNKPLSEFYIRKKPPYKVCSECKECARKKQRARSREQVNADAARYREKHRETLREKRRIERITNRERILETNRKSSLLRKYNLRQLDFDKLVEAQKGRCAICRDKFTRRRQMCVDHCHVGNHVRGLLCVRCNAGEGNMRTSQNAYRLMLYMEKNELFEKRNTNGRQELMTERNS